MLEVRETGFSQIDRTGVSRNDLPLPGMRK
nr:MAG TPA: hypothetical protein [Caudoviricetes sp.]